MLQLGFQHLEDALIAIASSEAAVSRAVISSSSTTFLAHNTVAGYSAIDFRRPDNSQLRELSALLAVHCDLDQSDRFYAGLYRDMIRLMSPATDVVFQQDSVSSPGEPTPPSGDGRSADSGAGQRSAPSVLVAFGDSFTYGEEIDSCEVGRVDEAYRIERAFPTVVARELEIPKVVNRGEPGASNAKILRDLCDFVQAHRHDLTPYFFVVSLTHPSRKAFVMTNGGDGRFISWGAGMSPKVLRTLCVRAFFAVEDDAAANDSVNQELSHKISMVSAFMRRMGCRFVIFPAWNFAASDAYFRDVDVGREVALYLGERGAFGMKDLVSHLPMGPRQHPLSQGHAHFGRELASFIRQRGL
jgi:hypothetical protein